MKWTRWAMLVAGLALLAASLWSAAQTEQTRSSCDVTPPSALQQTEVTLARSSTHADASAYALYRISPSHVDSDNDSDVLHLPVLFVPGHRGSYEQVAHIASALSTGQPSARFDVYSVSFGVGAGAEAAFSAQILSEQATFVNDALRHLQGIYGAPRSTRRIQAIGLSFGGMVLRLAVLAEDHPTVISASIPSHSASCLSVLYTLSSPHRAHPLFTEPRMSRVYDDLNHRWARLLRGEKSSSSVLSHLALVSISGGSRDMMVRSDLATIDGIAPPSHGMHIYTSSIDGVHTEIDHDSIVSCGRFVSKLASAITSIGRRDAEEPAIVQHMPALRSLLQSSTPTKFHLRARQKWRPSGVDEEEMQATIVLTEEERHQLRIEDTPLVLSSPVIRNVTELHRPILVSLPTVAASSRCEGSDGNRHVYPPVPGGIYTLDMQSPYSASPPVHVLHLPETGPYEYLILLTNVPAELICAAMIDTHGRTRHAEEWIAHAPDNDPRAHRWFNEAGVRASQPMSVLMLHHRDLPLVARAEFRFHLPPNSDGAPLWALVQFTPPLIITTQVTRGWLSTTVRSVHTAFISVPLDGSRAPPHAATITFDRIMPEDVGTAEPTRALFHPFAYALSLPSGESSWQFDFDPKAPVLHYPPTHAATHAQTSHLLLFVDPRLRYHFHVSTDLPSLLGQHLRIWYGAILLAAFAFIVVAISLQLRASETYIKVATDDKHERHVHSSASPSPLYATLVAHSRECLIGSLVYLAMLSIVRTIAAVRNEAYVPSFIVSFSYAIVGWSVIVTVHCLARSARSCLVWLLAARYDRQRYAQLETTIPPFASFDSDNQPVWPLPTSVGYALVMAAAFLLVWAPLPLFLLAVCCFWLHLVFGDCDRRSGYSRPSRLMRSLSDAVWFLFATAAVIRAPAVFHQLHSLSRWRAADIVWADSVQVALCLALMARLAQANSVVCRSTPRAHSHANRLLIIDTRVVYAVCALLLLFAPYFAQQHLHRTLLAAAGIAAAILAYDAIQCLRRIVACCCSFLTGSRASSELSPTLLDPSTPTIEMIADRTTAHQTKGTDKGKPEEMQVLLVRHEWV